MAVNMHLGLHVASRTLANAEDVVGARGDHFVDLAGRVDASFGTGSPIPGPMVKDALVVLSRCLALRASTHNQHCEHSLLSLP